MAVFHRVFSSSLDVKKHWYALNSDVCGTLPRKFSNYKVFKAFSSDIREVAIEELTTIDGGEVPAKWFVGSEYNANKKRTQNVFVSSTLGVFAGILNSCKEENTKTLGPIKYILDLIQEQRLDNDVSTPKAKKRLLVDESTPNHAHFKLNQPNLIQSSPPNLVNQSSPPNLINQSSPPNLINQSSPPNLINQSSPPNLINQSRPPNLKLNYSKPRPPNLDSSSSSCSSGSNEYSIIEIKNSDYTPAVKKRKIRRQAKRVITEVQDVCTRNRETLASALAESCIVDGKKYSFARSTITQVFDEVVKRKGCKRAFKELLSEDTMEKHYESMRVPDWQYLLLKLEARTPDKSWQIFVNRTNLGRNKTNGTPIIPLKNHMKALRDMVNTTVHDLFQVRPLPNQIPGYQISLASAIIWSIREQRLHGCDKGNDFMEFHLKLDGRPLFGKDQINIGIIPAKHPYLSSQSSKAVYTVAIANCEENRKNIRDLIVDINFQKDQIKRNGISIDGKLYRIKFKVILDYKGFCLLLAKANDDNFELGGKGLNVEFCMFCHAIRLCTNCDLGPNEVCLKHFSMCKANIGGFQGIRDDLSFLLEEDMTSVNICALHCEMRNMENLLASLGLLCHEVHSLKECNEALSQFGPKSFKKDRIHVVMKPGQESSAERHNIKVSSFSGSTEREFLENCEQIVLESLPKDKLINNYFRDAETAKLFILNQVSFCQERLKYYQDLKGKGKFIRDFGSHQEEIEIEKEAVGTTITDFLTDWSHKKDELSENFKELYNSSKPKSVKKGKGGKLKSQVVNHNSLGLRSYAAELMIELYLKVFTQWKEIALIIRKKEFPKDQEYAIDIFDLKCKEWGFLLRHTFGPRLGTGDYGHMVIDHAPMLLRLHRSIGKMSNQGFEANHKIHRQLYAQASSHDSPGHAASLEQIITHQYSEELLFLRLCFRQAIVSIEKRTPFHFPGCHWKKSHKIDWSSNDISWIYKIDALFTSIFSHDTLQYQYQKKVLQDGSIKNGKCIVHPDDLPTFVYNHEEWERLYNVSSPASTSPLASPASTSPPASPASTSTQASPASTSPPASPASTSPPASPASTSTQASPTYTSPPASPASTSTQASPASTSPPASPASTSPPASPASTSSTQASPASTTSTQASPASTSSTQASPASTSSTQASPASTSSTQASPASTSSTQASPASTSTPASPASSTSPLSICITTSATRGQLAGVSLPPVLYITKNQVQIVKTNSIPQDPFQLSHRPSENVVQIAMKMIRDIDGPYNLTGTKATNLSVTLGALGMFDYNGLEVCEGFCKAANIQKKVNAEVLWLKDNNIKDLLLSMRPTEEFLKVGNLIMDAADFSNLACERYIDSNTIDISCLTFLEVNKPSTGLIIYVPSYTPTWASCGIQFLKNKLSHFLPSPGSSNVLQVLCPIHVDNVHWGLLYVDVVQGKVLYDDGLHLMPPRNFYLVVRNLMEVLKLTYPHCQALINHDWSSARYVRFGMPTQPSQGEGSSSCGVGVIFAVRDIIQQVGQGTTKFSWTFKNSSLMREQIMKELIMLRNGICTTT